MRLVVTTHSPYILTVFNNLVQAGLRYQESNAKGKERLSKIVPESRALFPGEVAAYALDAGEAKSIISPDTKLIDAYVIDAVSDELTKEFDSLLWEST